MEYGYFHPDRGYWQTTNEPAQHILDGYPTGTVEVPLKPSALHQWNGTAWAEVTPTPAEALAAERAAMKCSRKQGKLAIGPTLWASTEALLADMEADPDVADATVWALKVAVYDAMEWQRLDADMAALIWALNLTDTQADDLFRLAMTL